MGTTGQKRDSEVKGMKNKMAMWISLWMIAGIFFISNQNSKSQESQTNLIQQTNQTNIYKAPTSFPPECRAYDQKLISKIVDKWHDLLDKSAFHSSDGGKVIAGFKLFQDGNISDIKISGDTNLVVAPLCIQAIKDCSPFLKWPDTMRSTVETNYREVNFTFYVNQQPPK